ncbi:uncharacterized protein LOC115233477 isoform X1 [Formica exsecta]|uniref:uncharacterized protein LOC115233477 isoform X1 n=1 Tax=Formica exsecta TaxID=72781 RepID=UPI001141450D|nr:uncharacterized protein LOC115233477 isoform X1 [Formica exsecta]XP_029659795.1 uncharacterized protein LOC115233477 isoform X1 [Formica exsecta]XP_029659796.1 uncharacterized protein LOC115233477 isoform X1 [Formica exsecta]XP_029659797.1 uncharacterized protein LOC115233477 isoform X1 [Formica exsecta]
MPGIYVRTLSQFDWLNQEKESLLTIPGSYWLCHKKNIYKFIFKYHRSVKNTMQFSYGRELLKIVRRIIKCHPSQGQQFGTPHLLVTYNCTSWTRQDKMFAILKFQQRTNAATFSHAFVLTIRIYPSSEHSLFSLKYPIVKEADAGTTFKDLNVSLDTKEKITKTMIYTTDKVSPKKTAIYQNKEDQISKYSAIEDTFNKTSETKVSGFQDDILKNSEHFDESLNPTIKSAQTAAEVHFINTEFQDNINENKSTNCNIRKCGRKVDQHSVDHIRKQSLRATKKMDKIPIEKIDDRNKETKSIVIQKPNQEIQNIRKNKIFSSLKSGMIKDDVDKWTLSNGFGFYENSMEKNICSLNNKDILDDRGKTISETIVNSDNVPDQYFIEKEVQYKKRSNTPFSAINQPMQRDSPTEINNINEHSILEVTKRNNNESKHTKLKEHCNEITDLKSQKNYKQHTTISISTDNQLSVNNTCNKSYKIRKQKSRESERKTISDDKVLRSSNITDLVMEGLMFTIRQDQDSVAVIEQKTKLEMDEVLENSEKVETKAGEKCLLNSSLLRLENLVTMIDSPLEHNKDQQDKTICHAICNNTCLSSFNIFPDSPVYNLDVNSIDDKMDKLNIPTSYDKHNVIDYLNPCESQGQRKCTSSSIKNNNGCLTREMITERSEQLMEQQDDEHNREDRNNIETVKEQRKDFSPQVFQPILFSSEKKNAGLQNRDLLTDNTDIEETSKHEMSVKRFYNSSLSSSLSSPRKMFTKKENFINSEESGSTKLFRQETNGPRIVSDKAITIEQMPLALQKVIQHTCKTRRPSTSNNEILQHEQKTQYTILTENAASETAISFIDKNINSNIKSNLSVEFKIDSEEIKSYKNESCITINKDTLETNEDVCVKNTKEKKNESDRTSRRNSSSKNGLPRKLQDITEDFYYDLLHARNKDNAIRQRCLRQRQRSLNNPDNIRNGKVRIEMSKFIQDITEGARVVVRRLNIDK